MLCAPLREISWWAFWSQKFHLFYKDDTRETIIKRTPLDALQN
jgi:hypothetical protein